MSSAWISKCTTRPMFSSSAFDPNANRLASVATCMSSMSLIDAYRRTGADLPWGDPVAPHGVPMEGWFWRLSDAASGCVVVVLCGLCRGRAGEWTMVKIASSPGGFVRTQLCPPARVDPGGRSIDVPGGVLRARPFELRLDLGEGARLEVAL